MIKSLLIYFTVAIFAALMFASTNISAQAQPCPLSNNQWQWPTHTNWFFGDARKISFGAGGSSAASIGTITGAGSPFKSYESCAAASDESGNMVFFTNGVDVWDGAGNQVAVPGGRLLTGSEIPTGDAGSAVQGVLIVKHPLDIDNYYIFTTDDAIAGQDWNTSLGAAKTPATYGFNYYVYKKSTNTITGPTRLKDAGGANYRSTEQVAATFHANGRDIWIVTHEATPTTAPKNQTVSTQKYFAYKLSCSGIDPVPVVSSLGFRVTVGSDWLGSSDRSNERSSLQFSWNGTKAAATHHRGNGAISNINECVSIMDFNNTTGAFSNSVPINGSTIDVSNPYDCEFSPSGNRLYVTFLSGPWDVPAINGKVAYYNLAAGNTYNLVSNISTTVDAGIIKLGGDGKMYTGSFGSSPWGYRNAVGVVNNPDGAASFNASGVATTNGTVSYGLPNMFVPPRDYLKIRDTSVTECDLPLDMGVRWKCKGTDAEDITLNGWSIKGTPAGGSITASNGIFNATAPGVYEVYYAICSIKDTALITVITCDCPVDLKVSQPKICVGGQVKLDSLVLGGPGVWSIDSVPTSTGTNPVLTISAGDTLFTSYASSKVGTYKLLFKDPADASCRDSVYIVINAKPVVTPTDQTICFGDPAATFDANAVFTSYNWDNGLGNAKTYNTSTQGNHTLYVVDANGCKDSATVVLTVNSKPNVAVASKSICDGDAAWEFDAGSGFTTYNWDNGAGSAQKFSTKVNGQHTVYITDSKGCKDTATATLTVNPKPSISFPNKTICDGDAAATFDAGAGFTTYIWDGAAATQVLTTKVNGTHEAIVTDANGCKDTASATLTVNPKPSITVADQTKCPLDGDQTFSTTPAGFTTYNWDNGTASTPTFATSAQGDHTVIVTDANGCKDTATAKLNVLTQFDATISVTAAQDTVCQSATSFSVTKVMPGGTWSATCGICIDNNGVFNPATATIGSNTITYSNSSSCGDTQTVKVFVLPTITSTITRDTALCVNETYTPSNTFLPVDPATLGFPIPGVWKFVGAGNPAALNPVTGAFDASIAGAGTYKIKYDMPLYPCYVADEITIRVDAMPNPLVTPVSPMCANAPIKVLAANTIGTWTTTAPAGSITGNNFNPAIAGAGNWEIRNTVSNGKCSTWDTITVNVKTVPVITLTPIPDQCLGSALVDLTPYDQPDSGTWSGTGVTGTNFNPNSVGLKTLTYSIGGLCPVSKTIDVNVQTTPNPIITGDTTICENVTTGIQLSADDAGGTWVGTGVNSSGLFSNTGLAPGNYPIEYQMNNVLCKDTAFYNIRIIDVPKTDFVADIREGCGNLLVRFTDKSDSIPILSSWNFNQGSGPSSYIGVVPGVPYNVEGEFDAKLINTYSSGCVSQELKPAYIKVYAVPNAEFTSTPDLISTLSPVANFFDASTSTASVVDWKWTITEKGTPATSTLQNPEVTFSSDVDDTIPVQLNIIDSHGCLDSVVHNVIIRTNTTIFVPNAFTPNGDGVNDAFIPRGINFGEQGYEFIVFDRWGEVIFKTNNSTEPWDGKRNNTMQDAQIDVYVWKVTYVDHFSGVKQDPIVGHVSLIR
ncbi:MAG: gliding motility-associated C-terminal domain-containing protein [Flavobacteriales bacterium]